MSNNKNTLITICLFAGLMLTACATKQQTTGDKGNGTTGKEQSLVKGLRFVQKVSDNAVYSKNIVSKIDFSINTGGKNISVGGSIHMRKDAVIRIQLTPMGLIEVGRIELTPDYVLIMDRIHKEYIKAAYKDVEFLNNNGLNFHSLQAMFWNQLFLPGEQRVSENALEQYETGNGAENQTPITLKQGNMTYTWHADNNSALIQKAVVAYESKKHGTSKLDWTYGDFKTLGTKKFPANHQFILSTDATGKNKEIKVGIKMNKLTTDASWDAETTVPGKYKAVTVDDVIKKIMNM